jgi:polysaccharide pyruvyl transferase WcaK-like protein
MADHFVSSAVQSFDCLPLAVERLLVETPKKEKTLVIAGSVFFRPVGLVALVAFANRMKQAGYRPVVVTGARAQPATDDADFVDALHGHDTRDWTYTDAKSLEEWLTTIGSAALLVSGRFHHSLAAFALRTPFVMLHSNTRKMNALAAMLGTPEPLKYDDPGLGVLLEARADHAQSEDFARTVFRDDRIDSLRELARKNLPPS